MSLDIDITISTRVVPAALIPIRSFICDVTISMATADVNPELTGPEMKSIKKPARHFCVLFYIIDINLFFSNSLPSPIDPIVS